MPKLETIHVPLSTVQQTLLDLLRERMPNIDDDELLQLLVAKGLFTLLHENVDRVLPPAEEKQATASVKEFPTHYRLILEPAEHTALEHLYELEPRWREPLELLHKVIQEGIKAMNRAGASKRDPTRPTRSELEVSREQDAARLQRRAQTKSPVLALLDKIEAEDRGEALSLSFPARMTVHLSPEQVEGMTEIADREPHESDAQLLEAVISKGIESMKETSAPLRATAQRAPLNRRARHKENAKEVRLEDRLRKKLTKFLRQHPDVMRSEEARKLLADLGER
ncbi:MAG: hypothetical protein U0270_16805 [Labilithrix sp.]